MSSGSLNVLRKGVIASVKLKNRRVQSPVVCCSVSTGLIPKSLRNNPQLNKTNGSDETRTPAPFVHWLVSSFRKIAAVLVELLQVHAVIQRSNLIAIAIERQCLAAEELSQPVLRGLAPARVFHRRIHVGIESVLVRRGVVPSGRRFFFLAFDLHDRLDALIAGSPRPDD